MLSDRFGRRPVLLISIFGLGVDYLFMALAPSLAWLFLGRIINGITAASFSTAGAYIADVTPPQDRAKNFGLLGAAFSIGFVIGPALGGYLGEINLRLPFYVAAGLALLNWLYGFLILPESLPPERRAKKFEWRRANPLGSLRLLLSHKDLIGLASVTFIYQLAHNVFPSIFVLYTGYRFGWSPQDVGLMMMAVGAASAVVQFGLVRPAVKRLGERGALFVGLLAGIAGFAIYGLAWSWQVFALGIPVFALAALIGPAVQSLMSRRVQPSEQGQLQGANSAFMGIASIVAPLIFTQLFAWSIATQDQLGVPGVPMLVAAGLLAVALLLSLGVARPAREPAAA